MKMLGIKCFFNKIFKIDDPGPGQKGQFRFQKVSLDKSVLYTL